MGFNIRVLGHPESGIKNVIVKVLVKDIIIDFFKQPVMRIIDYILVQLLPSL
jgi:hypothetical protein